MKKFFMCLVSMVGIVTGFAQGIERPKLVVGIVVDQMRWDYLYRFYDRYGTGGFRRLINQGFSCENTFIPYTPTYTAAGHASIYTGSVPALNGIMGNNWYDPDLKRSVYCTEDNTVTSVGTTASAGKMSPRNLWSSTITDELRLATNFQSKTIAIALKDRGSILPGGHSSNGSYWFDNATGGWVTSSFFMEELPKWMREFNARKLPDAFVSGNWNTLYPLHTYKQSAKDSNSYEGKLPGEDFTFPHITATSANRYEMFRNMPQSNTYTFETGKAAIIGEKLGKRNTTDFLALSFSSPDYIGHTFGPNSVEIEDAYLRLDKDIADFLNYLDVNIGKGRYLVFLTADHAVAHNPSFLKDNRIASGIFDQTGMRSRLVDSLEKYFGNRNIISTMINYQVYLNDSVIQVNNLDRVAIKNRLKSIIIRQPGAAAVVDLTELASTTLPDKVKLMLTNGYNQKLSGDLQVIYRPQYFENWRTGSNHGMWNPYDSHIPLLWFGWKIKPGKTNREVYMTDIAPTLAGMLHIQMPNACIGEVIEEVGK